ncbi:MAG: 3,4-dihydroxy-2-butanone-4-phosphate synthase [Phycisphaerales bacterium]|nr:MAG: 3,4-dihydroxy-2-butanone-4-phosphate synthase [Phycisphaerales bacterium]
MTPSQSQPAPPFSPVEEVLDELRAGRMIVLTDDEDRENEGDLVLPAQFVTPEAITFMLSEARGYLCLSLTETDCERLDLEPQSAVNTSVRGTPFTVSIDGHPKHGFTTGVSAKERARCIRMAIDPSTTPADFVRPGHINPLRSRDGGVLVRTGQTEGSVDLCRLAGLTQAAIIIEIMNDDGEMARVPDLEKFCARHKIKMCSVAQIIEHRLARESMVRRIDPVEGAPLRTREGEFRLIGYESVVDPLPHIALVAGEVGLQDASRRPVVIERPTLVRMHRRNLLGDIFGDLDSSPDGPTGEVLKAAMRMIQRDGSGAIVYLRPEGEGTSLRDRLQAIKRPDRRGADAPDLTDPGGLGAAALPMHLREFGIGGQILRDLGLTNLRLISNRAKDFPGIEAFGLKICETVPVEGSGA